MPSIFSLLTWFSINTPAYVLYSYNNFVAPPPPPHQQPLSPPTPPTPLDHTHTHPDVVGQAVER